MSGLRAHVARKHGDWTSHVERFFTPVPVVHPPVGLENFGATCFFNALLQCLTQTPEVVKLVAEEQSGGMYLWALKSILSQNIFQHRKMI